MLRLSTWFFLGLDTLCDVYLNREWIGAGDNQFRSWEFDVTSMLKPGSNRVRVHFHETFSYISERRKKRSLNAAGEGQHRLPGSNFIRKSQCNYGWDWGPQCVTCGITGTVKLKTAGLPEIRLGKIFQSHSLETVELDIEYALENNGNGQGTQVVLQTELDGTIISDAVIPLKGQPQEGRAAITIPDPQLWWTHELGEQPLYVIRLQLKDPSNRVLSFSEKRIGLRTVTLRQDYDAWGKSFFFELNGIALFARGANWIPADTFPAGIGEETYRYLIQSSKQAHMNMLRVWGGGIYEPDSFYNICDEEGILVWQDLMFACSAYPVFDDIWLDSVLAEIKETVIRLRHHPSIALWCGNNEIEQLNEELVGGGDGLMPWTEYCRLFDELIPDVIKVNDPERGYWVSSPHTPDGNRLDANDPRSGDAHLWEVWHGRKPFEWYRHCEHRFVSEFGFQSFPEPEALELFTAYEDRNINTRVMDLHQRSPIGNDAIIQYMLSWFQLPKK